MVQARTCRFEFSADSFIGGAKSTRFISQRISFGQPVMRVWNVKGSALQKCFERQHQKIIREPSFSL